MYNIIVYNLTYKEANRLVREMCNMAAFDMNTKAHLCRSDSQYMVLLITTSDDRFNYSWWQKEHTRRTNVLREMSGTTNQDMDYYVTDNDEAAKELINCLIE